MIIWFKRVYDVFGLRFWLIVLIRKFDVLYDFVDKVLIENIVYSSLFKCWEIDINLSEF